MIPHDALLALQASLEGYFAAVARQKEARPPALIPFFERIDGWEARWRGQLPAQLAHYLHKKSYQKALAYLRGEEAEEG